MHHSNLLVHRRKIVFGFFLLCSLLLTTNSKAQDAETHGGVSVSGRIIDKKTDQGIPHATLFIKEVQRGAVANENGFFNLHLTPGQYSVIIRSLGYRSQQASIRVSEGDSEFKFTLSPISYALGDVNVNLSNRNEDPAYAIMRRVMNRTPIYEKMIEKYVSLTYTKGSTMLEKVPFYLRKVKSDGISMNDLVGKRFVIEGEVKTTYTAPEDYDYHTLSMRSSVPEELNKSGKGLGILNSMMSNIYGKNIGLGQGGSIPSPIRLNGLYTYKYKLQGINTEGEETIYHISFVDQETNSATGDLWISDKVWTPVRVIVNLRIQAVMDQKLEVTLNPVREDVYMPTSYALNMNLAVLGIKMNFKYYSSTSYKELKLNESMLALKEERAEDEQKILPKEDLLTPTKRSTQRRIEKDLMLIENKMDTLGLQLKDKYMIPIRRKSIKSTMDSLALSKDSIYWKHVITTPLTEDELRSYAIRDSLMAISKREKTLSPKRKGERTGQDPVSTILFGYDKLFGQKWTVGIDGLALMLFKNYRYSDGLWMGPSFFLKYHNRNFDNPFSFELSPGIYYTTLNKQIYWDVQADIKYAGMRRGAFSLSAGRHSEDIGDTKMSVIENLENNFFTLIDGRYTYMFYDKTYLRAENKIDLFNGVTLTLGGEYKRSAYLPDNHVWGITKQERMSWLNFMNARMTSDRYYSMDTHNSGTIDVSLTFNTHPYYKVNLGQKSVLNEKNFDIDIREVLEVSRSSDRDGKRTLSIDLNTSTNDADWRYRNYAFFTLKYKHALPRPNTLDSDYSLFVASVYGVSSLSRFYVIQYDLAFGFYPHRTRMYVDDMHYVKRANTSEMKNRELLFYTLPPYTYASQMFGKANISAPLPKILGHVFGKMKGLTQEKIFLKGYWDKVSPTKPYLEAGYSIGLPTGTQIGVFYGGYNLKEDNGLAIRVGLRL